LIKRKREVLGGGVMMMICFSVMNKLIFGMKKMYGDLKIECLESLIANITEFDSAYMELRAAGILDILIHK
jgi:hypothetical protein